MAKDEPYHSGPGHTTKPNAGSAPRVGQGRPYAGQNAHGVHQRPTKGPEPGERSGVMPMSEPHKKTY